MALEHKNVLLKLLLFILLINNVTSAALSLADQKKYKQLIEGQGLYSPDDHIEIYTFNNFKTIYGQNKGILIEFYNSWCGFCQRFAPAWKALAADIREWKDLIDIGAIDCSDEDNTAICREFEIMGYPTLRYFHENYYEGPKMIGIDVKKGEDMDKIRENLIETLIAEQNAGRGKIYPNILPFEGENVYSILETVPNTIKYVFIIIDKKSSLGAQISLDLHNINNISIRSVEETNKKIFQNQNINSFPAVIIIDTHDKSVKNMKLDSYTRENVNKAVKEYLKEQGITVPEEQKKNNTFHGKWLENPVPDLAALLEAREKQALLQRVKKMGDVVFQVDLETALRSSLKHEVATTKIITGDKLESLKLFLNIIIKYFPFGRKGKIFFEGLRNKMNTDSVKGEDVASYLEPMDNEEEGIFSSQQQWLGCSGSLPKYRGYPCGMWKMFHYLTVNAADQNGDKTDKNPREVLDAMLGYIKHFFGCAECSKHFQEMAIKRDMKGVTELNSSIIWLWLAHNEVNKRLSGDATEDPDYPKIQFPSVENCPKCRDGEKWNLQEVLHYLRQMYSSINVRYLGADTKVLHDGLGNVRTKRSTSTWQIITKMDVSMCFLLYVVCFGLLVLIIRQFLRKGYRKKMYVHDILGKV